MERNDTRLPTLLIVDDEVPVATLLRDVLQDEGFAVTVCTTADRALTVLRTQPIDLILSDVMMPGVDGIAFAQQARALPACPPIIFLTAGARTAVQAVFPEARVLAKPFDLDVLLDQVAVALPPR